MILQALANYYERLSMREDSGLAPRGFSPEQVSYEIGVFADQCGCNRAFSGSGGRKLAMTLSPR